jgi:hypothetical protein
MRVRVLCECACVSLRACVRVHARVWLPASALTPALSFSDTYVCVCVCVCECRALTLSDTYVRVSESRLPKPA